MNNPTANITFYFDYDGSSATVSINTITGPLLYQFGPQFPSTFSEVATGVENVSINNQQVNLPTTAIMNRHILIVDIPNGFTNAPGNTVVATLIY